MNANDITHFRRIIEALIFASAEPVTDRVIRQHLPDDATYDAVMAALHLRYGPESGLDLCRIDDRWAIRTTEDVADHLRSIKESVKPLSRAALETLAIIAYHQPVTRAEIEEIRGVSISRGTMDILLEMGWIRPKGRRRTPGRPVTWGTSHGFLDHFGLTDINDLPGLEELKKTGLLRQGQTISDVLRSDDDLEDSADADEDQLMLDDLLTDEIESDWDEDEDEEGEGDYLAEDEDKP
jgi:segregation and condensation protein B